MLFDKKTLLLVLAGGILALSSIDAAVLTGVDPTIINVGSGPDISYLVIDESTLYSTPLEFVYHYTYDINNLISGTEFLNDVAAIPSSGLSVSFDQDFGPNSLNVVTYQGTTITGNSFYDSSVPGIYWSLNDAGGTESNNPNPPSTSWQYANVGSDDRYISPGSWDGWTLGSWDGTGNYYSYLPAIAISAVPEPATAPLLLLSLTGLAFLIRWKSSKRNSTL